MRGLLWPATAEGGIWTPTPHALGRQHAFMMRLLVEQSARLEVDSPLQLDWQTIVAVLVTIVGSALATSAGIGGGALFVPMFHVLVGFGLRTSTALSQTIITGGSLASVVLNAFRSNPADPSKPLIDYRLVLVFTPVLLLGVNSGVLMNTMFPEWLITAFLVSLILYLVISSFKKGRQLWNLEKEYTLIAAAHPEHHPLAVPPAQQYEELPEDDDSDHTSRRLRKSAEKVGGHAEVGAPRPSGDWDCLTEEEGKSTSGGVHAGGLMRALVAGSSRTGALRHRANTRRSLECQGGAGERPSWRLPVWLRRSAVHTAELLLLWGCFSAVQVFKTQTQLCSAEFWYFYGGQIVLMLGASVAATIQGMRLQDQQQAHPGHMVVVVEGVRRVASQPTGAVLQFTWKMMIISQFITLLAGITGGLLGIGGGMVMSPLLLQMGVEPQVSAATTSLMVLFSSSTAVVQFAVLGKLNVPYSLLFSLVSLLSSLLGVQVVSHYVRKSGKTSIIVIILAIVVSVGGLVTGVIGVQQALHDFRVGSGTGFTNLCPKL